MDATEGRGAVLPTPLSLPAAGSVVGIGDMAGPRPWRTRVEWSEGDVLCVVAPLRPAGDPWQLAPGDRLQVVWSTELGLLEATGTLRSADRDVVDLWVVDLHRVERYQRREAFRLPLSVPIVLRWQHREIAGETSDISETGLRCRVPARTAAIVAERVEMALAIVDEQPLVIPGEVTRSHPVPRTFADRVSAAPSEAKVDLGIVFVGLDAVVTDRVRRFVFEQQLRRRAGS